MKICNTLHTLISVFHPHRFLALSGFLVGQALSYQSPILRQNYGVIFKSFNSLHMEPKDHVNMTIATELDLSLPNITLLETDLKHNNLTLLPAITTLTKRCLITRDLIRQLITKDSTRGKRAALQIVGSLLQDLFGLATDPDIQDLKKKLGIAQGNIMADKMYNVDRDTLIIQLAKGHNEVLQIVSDHTKQAELIFNVYFQAMDNVTKTLQGDQTLLFKALKYSDIFQGHISLYMLLSEKYVYLLNTLLGLQSLCNNKLTPHLAHPATVHANLELLSLKNHNFRQLLKLYTTNPDYYYSHPVASLTSINESMVEITLQVPVHVPDYIRHMYKVSIFAVPLHAHDPTENGHTNIINVYKYIVFAKEGYSLTNDIQTIANCRTIHPLTFDTCTYALYRDATKDIKQLCNVNLVLTSPLPTTHVSLSKIEHLIVSQAKVATLICPNQTHDINQTAMTIIRISCDCIYKSKAFIIQASSVSCSETDKVVFTAMSGLNLPAAQAFNLHIPQIKASTLHNAPIHLDIPSSEEINKQLKNKISHAREGGISIQKAAELLQTKDNLNQFSFTNTFGDGSKIVHFSTNALSFVLSIISLTLSIVIFFRLQRLLTFISLIAGTHAFINFTHHTVPPLILRPAVKVETVAEQATTSSFPTNSTIVYVALAMVILAALWVKLYRKCKRKYVASLNTPTTEPSSTWLYLKIQHGIKIVDIPLYPIRHAINSIILKATPKILAIYVKRPYCYPAHNMVVTWTGKLRYEVMGEAFDFVPPTTIKIKRSTAKFLATFIKNSEQAITMYMTDGTGTPLQVDSSTMHPFALPTGIPPPEDTPLN